MFVKDGYEHIDGEKIYHADRIIKETARILETARTLFTSLAVSRGKKEQHLTI